MRQPLAAAAAVLLALLAGCAADPGEGETGGPSGTSGTPGTSAASSGESRTGIPAPGEDVAAFAVLEIQGTLTGAGPDPGQRVACAMAGPEGTVDLAGREATANPGTHSFDAGRTWLVAVDGVRIEDPRVSDCDVRLATPFVGEGEWRPQTRDRSFLLKVLPQAGGLLIGRHNLTEGAPYAVDLSFEEGDHTFSGRITFVHHGWWPVDAFRETGRTVRGDDPAAIWWT